jgi:hypothetical protein
VPAAGTAAERSDLLFSCELRLELQVLQLRDTYILHGDAQSLGRNNCAGLEVGEF